MIGLSGPQACLQGKTCGGILDIFMQQCAARGLWVMPDMHNLTIAGGIDDPLWYFTPLLVE